VNQILRDRFMSSLSPPAQKKPAGHKARPTERGSSKDRQSRRVPSNCISSMNKLMKSR